MKRGEQSGLILVPCFLLTSVVLFAAPASFHPGQAAAGEAAIRRAQSLLADGNIGGARRVLSAEIRQHPAEAGPRILFAELLKESGDFKSAEAQLALALKYAPNDPAALTRLGELYDHAGHPEKAEPILARAVEMARGSPYHNEASLAWAAALAKLHRYPEAEAALRGIGSPRNPNGYIAYHRLRASVELALGDANAAATDMEAALTAAPQDKKLEFATAVSELKAKQWKKAAAHLKPLFSATHDPDAGYYLALAQFRADELTEALEIAQDSAHVHDNGATEELLGEIQEKRGDSLAAVHSYQKAVALQPQIEAYWLTLSVELMRHETYKPALLVLNQAARRFPGSMRIRLALGLDEYLLENYPRAIQALLGAARQNPASPLPLDYLGEIDLQPAITPNPAAINVICRYADAHPRGGQTLAYCGALLARQERIHGRKTPSPEVLGRLRQAARVAPESATARCELGKGLEWAGQWQNARAEMEACTRLDPESAEAEYRLSRIYLHLGQTALAKAAMKQHDADVRNMVAANARRDAGMKKFLYTLAASGAN